MTKLLGHEIQNRTVSVIAVIGAISSVVASTAVLGGFVLWIMDIGAHQQHLQDAIDQQDRTIVAQAHALDTFSENLQHVVQQIYERQNENQAANNDALKAEEQRRDARRAVAFLGPAPLAHQSVDRLCDLRLPAKASRHPCQLKAASPVLCCAVYA